MTIGIAAYGPNAGLAVWTALRAVERIGSGAIGGFASFTAIGTDGRLHRVETQRGGTAGLFPDGAVPPDVALSRYAAVMSSGPDRPEPLAQFTPADPRVGLVTGHRIPNTLGAGGVRLNEEVLALMASGWSAERAVEQIVAANPEADAGFIALGLDGTIHAADTAYLAQFGDAGSARLGSAGEGAAVAVLHNAIRPCRSLALLAAETAYDVMVPPNAVVGHATMMAGVPVEPGDRNALRVDFEGRLVAVTVGNGKFTRGRWGIGLGYRVPVRYADGPVRHALYEPHLVVEDGRLVSIDGAPEFRLPVGSSGTSDPPG